MGGKSRQRGTVARGERTRRRWLESGIDGERFVQVRLGALGITEGVDGELLEGEVLQREAQVELRVRGREVGDVALQVGAGRRVRAVEERRVRPGGGLDALRQRKLALAAPKVGGAEILPPPPAPNKSQLEPVSEDDDEEEEEGV